VTARTLRVRVPGLPTGKGSVTRMPNGAMLNGKTPGQRQRYADWAEGVRNATDRTWAQQPPMAGPVAVELTVWMPRPKSRPRQVWHISAPDLDKMQRLIGDELTKAKVIVDDRIVAKWVSEKFLAGPDGFCGADIIVRELSIGDLEQIAREADEIRASQPDDEDEDW
jgi:Holliday junction resolvase RusA-like endonuclease